MTTGVRMTALTVKVEMITEECCNCGVLFAFTEDTYDKFRRTKQQFFCPYGHGQSYMGKTYAAQLQEARNDADYFKRQMEEAREQRALVERSLSATKGVLTRERKRVQNGVCPVCRRSFKGLAEHMHKQHPDFVEGELGGVGVPQVALPL